MVGSTTSTGYDNYPISTDSTTTDTSSGYRLTRRLSNRSDTYSTGGYKEFVEDLDIELKKKLLRLRRLLEVKEGWTERPMQKPIYRSQLKLSPIRVRNSLPRKIRLDYEI